VLWLWVLNPEYGVINMLLRPVLAVMTDGLRELAWLCTEISRIWGGDPARPLLVAFGADVPVPPYPVLEAPGWLADPNWSKPGLIMMSIWGVGHSMILYLASLQEVPVELYEASEIDGAGAWIRARHITLPMISPILFFTLVMGMIQTFQYFTQAFIMTDGGGGPADSTLFYALYLFNNAFIYHRMGYASAMAWILFVLILVCTALLFRGARGRVYYAGG
jgi:multiple sugar transport system permease protein